ncbi:hypothetical protein H9Q73_008248 [Fusarium xylarioides]|nr:hypothetical protein H9Q73_008248 [Fusarium xylarioides]
MYGPAETTIWCGGKHSVKPGDDAANIGYGVGARMWLTDVNDVQKPAPIGAVGEIVIEGPLLALGYTNGNNTAFVESPDWAKAFGIVVGFDRVTGRVYRSGDLGRYQSDGSIVICGGRDTQVKIRGQRVEVSQIEDQLQRLAPNFKCVVGVLRMETPTLVAFIGLERPQDQLLTGIIDLVVSGSDLSVEVRDLITGLESQLTNVLPPYSLPAHYLVLRKIPLMTSGKTDRKKLQPIASEHLEHSVNESKSQMLQQVRKIPTTEIEWNLFGLWAQVLGVNNLASLGTDDNLLRCGGDSLKATQLASLASQRGITLQVSDLFKHPVLADLAQDLDKAAIGGLGQSLQRFRLIQDVVTGQKNLVWTLHHAAYDGWSIQRILERVRLVYQDQPVPSPCVPFNAFIRYMSGVVLNHESKEFWQSYLSDITPPTFPALPSPAYQTLADTVIESKMSKLELPHSFTLTTVLRAAWAIVVGTYQRSDDVVFLTTVFGRNAPLPGIVTIMGPTIAIIPIRVKLGDPNTTVDTLLGAIDTGSATETMGFEQLGLQSIRNISTDCKAACMAQNLLVIQTGHEDDANAAFDGFEKLPDEAKGFSTMPFTIECTATSGGGLSIEASLDYKVIDPAQANRIIKTFEHVTSQMCATHLKLSQVDLISHADHDLISNWNSTSFDAEAVCAWDGNFTLKELIFLINRYAADLQSLGIQPGNFAPFRFDKSKWEVVTMLAIMKVGAASVTIDHKHPTGRRDGILLAVSASVVVTTSVHTHLLDNNASYGLKTLVLDEETMSDVPDSPQFAEIQSTPSDAAFVVYTSGSTGAPKAVVIEH